MRARRTFVGVFLGLLAVFGFGQLEVWPFTSWYMFSHVDPAVDHIARVVAVAPDGIEYALGTDTLPLGLLRHPLMQRLQRASAQVRARVCRAALAKARAHMEVSELRLEERVYRVLDRDGDRPAALRTTVVATCR
jgi:hypothetical protein